MATFICPRRVTLTLGIWMTLEKNPAFC